MNKAKSSDRNKANLLSVIIHHEIRRLLQLILLLVSFLPAQMNGQSAREEEELDRKVEHFLSKHLDDFHDMNVPQKDGELLFDLIIEGNYTRALEIGTSTGLSGIYMAWALSKTGGKLITIEIDEQRHKTALKHFEEAGLSKYIDARLANAHVLVKQLEGPFDFVFSDADKNWYKNYFTEIDPKLEVGGCYCTHNISPNRGGLNYDYLEFVMSQENYSSEEHPGTSMLVR